MEKIANIKKATAVRSHSAENEFYEKQVIKPSPKARTINLTYKKTEAAGTNESIYIGGIISDAVKTAGHIVEKLTGSTNILQPEQTMSFGALVSQAKSSPIRISKIKINTSNTDLFNDDIYIGTPKTNGGMDVQQIRLSDMASEFAYQSGILTLPVDFKLCENNLLLLDMKALAVDETVKISMEISEQKEN
jgi:hypothetical protein